MFKVGVAGLTLSSSSLCHVSGGNTTLTSQVNNQAENPVPSAKKPVSEIDEIFAAKKKKKTETGKAEKRKENAIEKPEKPKTKKEDGLTVYTEDELGINNADAGNTPLCPFDCSCCF